MKRYARYCPRCTYPMTVVRVDGHVIDHCHRCGGTAIEADEISGSVGAWADPKLWLDQLGHVTTGERLVCPVDLAVMTGYQVPFHGASVVVDHCGSCGTLWLDYGEGDKLVDIVQHANATGSAAVHSADDVELERRQDTEPPRGASSYLFQLLTGMPVEVWNPVRGKTPATQALLLLIVAIFGAQFALFLLNPEAGETLLKLLGLVPAEFMSKPWGIFTYGLLHAGLLHVLVNAYFLHVFGDNVEDRLGLERYLPLFVGASVAGGLLHLAWFPNSELPVVGASGAVAGLMGAYLVLFPRVKLWVIFFFIRWRIPVLVYFGFWVALQFLLAVLEVHTVAWTAHLGGFVVGLLAGWAWRNTPHPLEVDERKYSPR